MAKTFGLGVDLGSLGCRFAALVDNGAPLPILVSGQLEDLAFRAAAAGVRDLLLNWKQSLGDAANENRAAVTAGWVRSVLARGRAAAADELSGEAGQTVISVAASFSARQRQTLRDCAVAAHLPNVNLVSDSVAVVAARQPKAPEENLLVFQCGHSGFEVAVVCVLNDRIHVLSYTGGEGLSGRSLDQMLLGGATRRAHLEADALTSALDREYGLCSVAAGLRERLSRESEAAVKFLLPDGETADARISRHNVDQWTRQAIEPALDEVNAALTAARIRAADLSEIVIAGAPTAAAAFREALHDHLGKPVSRAPNWSPAFGAARLAARMATSAASQMRDVTLGVSSDDLATPSAVATNSDSLVIDLRRRESRASAPAQPPDEPARAPAGPRLAAVQALQRANDLIAAGRLNEAVSTSHLAYQEDKESAEVFAAMLDVHRRASEADQTPTGYPKAVEWLMCANGHDPTNGEIRRALADRHLLHARQLLDAGKPSEAEAAAQKAFQIRPESDEIEEVLDQARNAQS